MSQNTGYTDETEILTEYGFQSFKDISEMTKVGMYDIDTGEITFTTPIQIIAKDYQGKIHIYHDEKTSISVTNKHLLYFKKLDTKEEEFIPSKDFIDTSDWYYPGKGIINKDQYKNDDIDDVFKGEDSFKRYPKRHELDYSGKIYSVLVRTNMIITRYKGKVSINAC